MTMYFQGRAGARGTQSRGVPIASFGAGVACFAAGAGSCTAGNCCATSGRCNTLGPLKLGWGRFSTTLRFCWHPNSAETDRPTTRTAKRLLSIAILGPFRLKVWCDSVAPEFEFPGPQSRLHSASIDQLALRDDPIARSLVSDSPGTIQQSDTKNESDHSKLHNRRFALLRILDLEERLRRKAERTGDHVVREAQDRLVVLLHH